MPAYIPPHLRKSSQGETAAADLTNPTAATPEMSQDLLSMEDIRHHFWPPDEEKQNEEGRFPLTTPNRTLHDSKASPGRLSYLLLFDGANPRWDTDHIVFSKSSLELLSGIDVKKTVGEHEAPGAEANTSTTTTESGGKRSIAVFRQIGSGDGLHQRAFKWEGWFKIALLDILEPQSDELKRMLEQKFLRFDSMGRPVQAQRSSVGWQKSLALRWAVIKFAKDEDAERDLGQPSIEKLPEPEVDHQEQKQSVNEMLAELRMSKNSVDAVTPERTADNGSDSTLLHVKPDNTTDTVESQEDVV